MVPRIVTAFEVEDTEEQGAEIVIETGAMCTAFLCDSSCESAGAGFGFRV